MGIRCSSCGAVYPVNGRAWVCEACGGLLEIYGAPAFDANQIARGDASVWRYRAFIPLPENAAPISLGEGWTPLIPLAYNQRNIYCKLDFLNPTGSFKDRGATVIVSAVKAFGYARVVEDSSGNAAASLAGYSAYAGLHATIYTPAHASPMKLAQIEVYGAELKKIKGVRENAARAAQDALKQSGAYYASHYYNPFFTAGLQTTAWEIWEQLGHAPDVVIMPAGHGTNLVGMYRGFVALREANLIPTLPRFIAAQAARVAPVALAYERGAAEPARVEPAVTIAEGIANSQPVHGAELLRIVRETHGAAVAASEDEIRAARLKLARHGIFVEPTSATAMAVLEKVLPTLPPHETIVVSLTGNGLKAPL
jgi:threonine synthase